jgi:acyl-CoA synthetase (AMP-forming)/AMP-acid ligase II
LSSDIKALLGRGAAGDAALVIPDGPVLTYGRLRELTEQAALALVSHGLTPADRIAMVFPNGPEAVLLFLAASMVGVCCPLNAAYKEEEFRFYLEDTGARFLLVPPGEAAPARQALPSGSRVIEVVIDEAGAMKLSNGTSHHQVDSIDTSGPDATALVLHTSGTTSRPKRVPLSHRNLAASAENIIRSYELSSDDVSLCIMPLFHVHGLVASVLATLGSGGTVVVPRRYNPFAFRPLIEATTPMARPSATTSGRPRPRPG